MTLPQQPPLMESTTQPTDTSGAGQSGIFVLPSTNQGNVTASLRSYLLKTVRAMGKDDWTKENENDLAQHGVGAEDFEDTVWKSQKGATSSSCFISDDSSKSSPESANVNILVRIQTQSDNAGLAEIATTQLESETAQEMIPETKDDVIVVTSMDGGKTYTKEWDWAIPPPAYDTAEPSTDVPVSSDWIQFQLQICPPVQMKPVLTDLGQGVTPSEEPSDFFGQTQEGARY